MENNNGQKFLIIKEGKSMEKEELKPEDYLLDSGDESGITKKIELEEGKDVMVWVKKELMNEFEEKFEQDLEFTKEVIEILKLRYIKDI